MKIAVIGYSGAGKSTLSKQLSEFYDIPLLYLDKVQFGDNWSERNLMSAQKTVFNFMQNASWVIDGNYKSFYQKERLYEADKIVFLNFPSLICLFRVLKRYFQFKGKTRESMSDGCIEKLDFEFIKWVLLDGRAKDCKEHYKEIINTYRNKVIVLKNPNQVKAFLQKELI